MAEDKQRVYNNRVERDTKMCQLLVQSKPTLDNFEQQPILLKHRGRLPTKVEEEYGFMKRPFLPVLTDTKDRSSSITSTIKTLLDSSQQLTEDFMKRQNQRTGKY